MRNICVRDAPCWDQTLNVLNASSAKLQLRTLRGFELRMRIQNVTLKIHFPVPKCLCKQETKNVFNGSVTLHGNVIKFTKQI